MADFSKSIAENNLFFETTGRQRMPSISTEDGESFVVIATSSNGEIEEAEGLLPPVDSLRIREIQGHVSEELSKMNAVQTDQQLKFGLEWLQNAPLVKKQLMNGSTSSTGNFRSHIAELLSPTASLRSTESYDETQRKVEELIKENEKLKGIIMENNIRMKTQCEKLELWKEEVSALHATYKKKLTEAKVAIDKQKEVNLKLHEEVEKFKDIKKLQDEEILHYKAALTKNVSNEENITKVKHAELQQFDVVTQNKVKELEETIQTLQNEKAKLMEEKQELKAKLETRDEQYSSEQINLNELRKQLIEKNILLEENERKFHREISDFKIECDRLREEFRGETERNSIVIVQWQSEITGLKQLNSELMEQIDPNLQEKFEQVRLQLMNAQKRITELEVELNFVNTELIKKNEELREIKIQFEDTEILRTQMEYYKKDFEEEAQAKSALQEEKVKLSEDLVNLLRRNHELQEAVENAREIAGRSSKSTPKGGYQCPFCKSQFNNYRLLEEHVARCLNLH